MINYKIYDCDPYLEIGDMVHGYYRVRISKYCLIFYIFLKRLRSSCLKSPSV